MSDVLDIWVVRFNIVEYPGKYILHRERAMGPPITEVKFSVTDSLDAVRQMLPPGLHRLPRQPGDQPNIVETWF